MADKIILVSAPDDILIDGPRILLVNLAQDYSQTVSTTLLQMENLNFPLIVYTWNFGDSTAWLFDKKLKSQMIIFDASQNNCDTINGYLAAQPNSHYFGNLKDLQDVNKNAIYNVDNLLSIFERVVENYYETR